MSDLARLPLREKKRTRVQLSCTACRARKLKCCRTHPCTNCQKRGEAHSCTFVGRGPRGKNSGNGQASPAHVQDRLQHLENLILSFTQMKKEQGQEQGLERGQENEKGGGMGLGQGTEWGAGEHVVVHPQIQQQGTEEGSSPSEVAGKLVVGETGTRYIDGSHWSAILEEVSTKQELLDGLPPRPVTDRVIALFLRSKEPVCVIVHVPTFQREYNRFWSNPQDVSISWLGLLYACLTLTVAIYQRTSEPLPRELGDQAEAVKTFRKLTAQCVVQFNYTVPGRYKVEALFLYTMGEFYRTEDAQVGVSFLLGTTIRLAMRTGYHRDPRQFPDISPYEGEMRRRVWTVLRQLDILISFQVGLPRTVQEWHQDVEPPSNISDEEFDEFTQELPPSRPEEELTTASYIRCKSRLMSVFGKIADLAYSREPVTYEDSLAIDRQLDEAHDQLPAMFKMRPLNQSIVDPSVLILRRYTLELLYQKSRCVLHRRYLGEVQTNSRYAFSRRVCMSASRNILRHQADVHHETQPGGLLYRDRQYPNSLQHADYLLGAMIICLELSQDPTGARKGSPDNDVGAVMQDREDLLSTLETSHRIFESQRGSADVQKACAALTVMLRRVKGAQNAAREQLALAQPPPYDSWQVDSSYPLVDLPEINDLPEHPSLDVIEEMLDAPTNLDWRLWDEHITNTGFEGGMELWDDPAISQI
ncbi:hypothetical protein BO70DRAFT_307947 [Aspergillus heteromorphus CBS 117.55]|uniref:Zn(2)-C6 fungal-type domain-containing protein n=1 Tax=Aspergillus heteromorphus CBS 117.55 TaxID=1448321 RepID=A0A317WZ42_9EURO|nr:uncharacterized protein BO70DRAFT_307947 [Aspergillus heteromorphus CBS 117.55]PWY91241.1 hypothetical protein BO70DRAFT_307947 [Aspergillus heteromorphus CBS 117.55]